MSLIDDLNRKFGIENILTFKEGPNGFVYVHIKNHSASAEVFLHGAHITSFIPNNSEPVIFLSTDALLEPGSAIRGGIPISWPWFADHPTNETKPAHGFARTSLWQVRGSENISDNETKITFGFNDNEETRKLWEYSFDLQLDVIVGEDLNAELTMANISSQEFTISSAFHSYYLVGEVEDTLITGLEQTKYIDKVDNYGTKTQNGPVKITDETDRIYIDTKNDCVIHDRELNREIIIRKTGSNSTVVWNPWAEKAMGMKDLGDLDYIKFVCIETTNAGNDLISIAPGDRHVLGLNVSVKNSSDYMNLNFLVVRIFV